ncbi:GspH/FimT family protein [Spongiibacter pelagi]|nr:GspH/FimT family protein [Spongiibacter pelagi]
MNDFIVSSRASAEVRSLMRFVASARSEAIAQAQPVSISRISDNWSGGWRSWIDVNGNGQYDAGETLKQQSAIGSKSSISIKQTDAAISTFRFNSEGFLDSAAVIAIEYRSYPEKCSVDRNMTLNLSGQLTLSERSCS